MSTVGMQLIDELGRRRQLGAYFDYAGYRALRKVNALPDLANFVRSRGITCPASPRNVEDVADALNEYDEMQAHPAVWAFLLSDPTGMIPTLFWPLWLLSRLFQRR